jgi:hypothetical protein
MLAYDCKQCKTISIMGYKNEYNEFFCSVKCYELYCAIHGYDADVSKLQPINNWN